MNTQTCDICGPPKEWKEAGVRKDGTPFDGFMGCPRWRDPDHKNKPKNGARGGFYSKPTSTTENPNKLILDEIIALKQHLDERLDNLGAYLNKKFDK